MMSWASREANCEFASELDCELAVELDVVEDVSLADEFDKSLIRLAKSFFSVDSVELEELLELLLKALVMSFSSVEMSLPTAELLLEDVLSLLDGGGGGGGGRMALAVEDELDDDELSVPPFKALAMSLINALMSLPIVEPEEDDEELSPPNCGGGGMALAESEELDEFHDESPDCCAWIRVACIDELID